MPAPASLPKPAPAPAPKLASKPVPAAVLVAGPAEVEAYQLVTLTAVNADPAAHGLWWTVRRADRDRQKKLTYAGLAAGGTRNAPSVQWVGPPGEYDVTLTVVTAAPGRPPEVSEVEWAVTVKAPPDVAPAPKPKPPGPAPDPKPPEPKPPEPPAPAPDSALVAKLKAALAVDLAVPMTAAKKAHLADLAKVYRSTAVLVSLPDPAARPQTFKDVLATLVGASRLSGVPPPPEFTEVRGVVGAEAGEYAASAEVTKEFGAALAARYNKIADALDAAAR